MENVRKRRDIKHVRTDKKRNKLVSEPNYHTMKLIDDNLAIIEMRKVKFKMNKPIYLGLSILEISRITMYEFWYDYVKNKYDSRANLRYMDADSFVINIKTKDFYKDIDMDVKERFDTSNCNYDRPLPIGVNNFAKKKFAKTAGKKILKKTAKATGDLIGNKIADKITSASKKSHDEVNNERYISPKERQKIINELKLT